MRRHQVAVCWLHLLSVGSNNVASKAHLICRSVNFKLVASQTPSQSALSFTSDQVSVEAMRLLREMDPKSPSTPKDIAEYLHEMPHSESKMVGVLALLP